MSDRPYGEILDEMDHQAKYQPVSVLPELLWEVLVTLRHARIFICTREKIHPTGTDIELYDELIAKIEATLEQQDE